jgi:glycosyltransferase involved in cell wall biosynthesis
MQKISIISPIYNCSEVLEKFVDSVLYNIKKICKNYEIVLIDDYSKDDSWKKLITLKLKSKNIKIRKNKKNIGQHPTIKKALKIARGDLIFILDCDLQDDPKYFKKFLKIKINSETAVFGKIKKGSEQKGFFSILFWYLFNLLTNIDNLSEISTFALIDKLHSKELIKMNNDGFIYAEIKKKFPIKYIFYNRNKKFNNKSSYSYLKLLQLGYKWIKLYNRLR